MKKLSQKGEGLFQNLFFLAVFLGLAYVGYVYIWPMASGSGNAPTAATAAPNPSGDAKAGSMAGAAVQGAAAAGEVYGSGR